jgi:Asp-tRNA(Asn)/Glu-tRNA(Gln) amidotransferase B subunit
MSDTYAVITKQDDKWESGVRFDSHTHKEIPNSDWCRLKETLWFAETPPSIVQRWFPSLEKRRIEDLLSLFNDELDGFYYVANLTHEEAIKWIMGPMASLMKNEGLTFKQVSAMMPVDYMNAFTDALETQKFDKVFAKSVFEDFLKSKKFDDNYQRLIGANVLEIILANPAYKTVESSEIDNVIDDVINKNNEQFQNAKTNPKLINWLVGQCMKELKGKASATDITDKLKSRLS